VSRRVREAAGRPRIGEVLAPSVRCGHRAGIQRGVGACLGERRRCVNARSHRRSARQGRSCCSPSEPAPTCSRNPGPDGVLDIDAAPGLDQAEVGRIFREEYGRSVAALIRAFGDVDVAEDAVQEAFSVALRKWPSDGLPPNPGGWITTTARNRAIDRLRREARRRELLAEGRCFGPDTTIRGSQGGGARAR
jgi:Sigma-70 region 2